MSNLIKELVTRSLNFLDTNKEKYANLYSMIEYYKIDISNSDIEHNNIIFYDLNKNEIYRSRYEILGSYNSLTKTWIWSWSNPANSKKVTNIARSILNYGLNIDIDARNRILKSELITSRFKVSNFNQLDIHISIGAYLSKNPIIYNLVMRYDNKDNPTVDITKKIDIYDTLDVHYVYQSLILLDNYEK